MANHQVAIIGAGPAGLATGRVLKLLGIPFTIFEKHSDVGGIWDRTNEGSPMYRSAHFISSKTMSGHVDFPMPDHYPDYPSNTQILSYIHSFASEYGLYDHIRFNSHIESIELNEDGWVVYPKGEVGKSYRWLVCASGTNWFPNRPELPGESTFTGQIIHSVNYDDPETLRDKRVLVVGAGNSGVDIACDAAFASKSAHISLRRGYHFVPKH
ncbi:MAG: NAD(P)/FAD-dependent oxidoreductase, partial [Chloroflexota bacterium]